MHLYWLQYWLNNCDCGQFNSLCTQKAKTEKWMQTDYTPVSNLPQKRCQNSRFSVARQRMRSAWRQSHTDSVFPLWPHFHSPNPFQFCPLVAPEPQHARSRFHHHFHRNCFDPLLPANERIKEIVFISTGWHEAAQIPWKHVCVIGSYARLHITYRHFNEMWQ